MRPQASHEPAGSLPAPILSRMASQAARTGDDEVVLRPATGDDVDEVAELYLASRRAAEPAMPPQVHTPEEVRLHTAGLLRTHDVWVAEDADAILGYAAFTPTWLDGLYVGPQSQGTGIGSALLELVKAQRPQGFSLWVFASNAPARGFYHRHGLIELEHTDGSGNEERAPDVRMVWPGTDPLDFLRAQIDEVDDELALLLARRSALTAAVQGVKPTPGHRGRDEERERAIVARMARHAPGLGEEALARIMRVVIETSLDVYEGGRADDA